MVCADLYAMVQPISIEKDLTSFIFTMHDCRHNCLPRNGHEVPSPCSWMSLGECAGLAQILIAGHQDTA